MISDKPSLEKPTPRKKPKQLKDYFDFRNNQVNQIGLILFSAFIISTSIHFFFEERFTEKQWQTQPMTRHKIVDDLIDSRVLLNKSKPNVIKRLGQPSYILTKDIILYELGLAPQFNSDQVEHLYIEFSNEKVSKVSLTLYDY
ncbi:hypothetical protein ADIWIN_1647 [Winogradskyella psychrotolerans RS-3]|uniref:Uncharacterized protein n=1 Tax=Winogradskyella psychrotolerans RS-3 TaxID=641526 RepID=S7VT49_9FLAO|nr:hypothetical protein [Winogradskyella psychrotolerans]EPR73216.1 hypothetical protein ADIWIN_1647 [Winogradskyella psychrotolerans RS-3]